MKTLLAFSLSMLCLHEAQAQTFVHHMHTNVVVSIDPIILTPQQVDEIIPLLSANGIQSDYNISSTNLLSLQLVRGFQAIPESVTPKTNTATKQVLYKTNYVRVPVFQVKIEAK